MNGWLTILTTIGRGRSKNTFVNVIFSVVLQSLAIYYAYRSIRWLRNRQYGARQKGSSSLRIEPAQRKDPNRDRELGGMFRFEDMSRG